jgi:hypothetical protein
MLSSTAIAAGTHVPSCTGAWSCMHGCVCRVTADSCMHERAGASVVRTLGLSPSSCMTFLHSVSSYRQPTGQTDTHWCGYTEGAGYSL